MTVQNFTMSFTACVDISHARAGGEMRDVYGRGNHGLQQVTVELSHCVFF